MYSHMSDDINNNRVILVNQPNRKTRYCCFKKHKFRVFSYTRPIFKTNLVATAKYNLLTFLPLNLMLQFSKGANLYFLLLMIMELY
mmetsp:Transcript_827/g.1490  ORF Transcript_827/g.1490 Transcript_827/m.1490 type:complete len:86 (-) Transcript_827:575-832(-)